MSESPSKRPSKYPPSSPPSANWVEPTRSIRPSQPRLRAALAALSLLLFGSLLVSAIVRTCEGEDTWKEAPEAEPSS